MDFVGSNFEIWKCIGPPLCKYIEYHRKREEYKQNLKRILEELKSQKDEIETRLKVECEVGKIRKNEVKHWLENVEMIIQNAENVEQTFKNGKCLSRVLLEYLQKSNSFNTFVIDAPPSTGIILPMAPLVGETMAKKNMEEIWRHLMDNETKNIGIFGIDRVGKTTIVTHINNRLIEEKKFPHVIWVTVSQTFDLVKVQNGIANALKQSLSGIENQKIWAGKLLSMLRETKFVLILDDMWEAIRLKEVGIHEPTKENRCKLVITTRSLDVCHSMNCKTVDMKLLSEKEASELFFEKARLNVSKVPNLKETVELIVKQCARLPPTIVTIASSLMGEEDIREWRNALSELTNNVMSIKVSDDGVFVQLKFSFDRLKDEKFKRCFLCCALYPEDHDILKTELVDCWIAERLVEEMDLQATKNRAHIMIKKLVNNCLLLESIDLEDRSCVKLHDVVRDMVLWYITSESPLFMVKGSLNLKALPNKQEWKEYLDKVSLMNNSIMSNSFNFVFTEEFFRNYSRIFLLQMHGLMILNLSETRIEGLPNSISELTVSRHSKLQALRILDLGITAINEAPTGIDMLTNLKSLDLFSRKLLKIPAGIFLKLCRLQRLVVYWGLETQRVAVKEAARLKNLDSVKAQFRNLQDFNSYVKSLNCHRGPNYFNLNKEVIIDSCDICRREENDSIILPKDVEFFWISYCEDVTNISGIPTFNTLERLEILLLLGLHNLTALLIMLKSTPPDQYSHLKVVRIKRCGEVKKLFSSKLLLELKNLKWIDVSDCPKIDDYDDDDNEERSQKEFLLHKLKKLSLEFMSELKNICNGNGVMVCDSLQESVIW
ncbi:hypothetical protein ACOSP7_021141 [Xanthoceras sorbifolium]